MEAALIQENLVGALQNASATLTVFAPDDNAFTALANALNTDIDGLLALPNLDDILKYHVLGVTVPSAAVTNGAVVNPLSPTNTLKLTKTALGSVYVNQAQVITADLTVDNGVVHVINSVVLPYETVVDVAIDGGFTSLFAALTKAELLPVLSNPLGTFTVFAPTNSAIDSLVSALGITLNDLLNSPILANVLKYHVLVNEVASTQITNGAIVQPVSTTNTLKLTKTTTGSVYVNQAKVTTADLPAYNGIVHVLDAVVLPFETVVDVAIDYNFTTLTSAVAKAELLPVLTNPFAEFTVFAPTNTAFDNLAIALNTDLNGILALPNLADVLTYHVVAGTVLSTDLVAGPVATVNGQNVTISLTGGVKVNDANVTTPNVTSQNGVVHVIDKVLLPSSSSIQESGLTDIKIYPNPSSDIINLISKEPLRFELTDLNGKIIFSGDVETSATVNITNLDSGLYLLNLYSQKGTKSLPIVKN